jgi:hypothetical chaperone protein
MLRGADRPEALAALIHVVDWNQGFHLHKCVEQTKVALSQADVAPFRYQDGPVDIAAEVTRAAFESWITPELMAIGGAVDAVLATAGVAPPAIDRVFLTGGSAFVPAVRAMFAERFGAEKLSGGDELVSIASGLASMAGALANAA